MMVKDSLFLLVSNILGRGCGAGRGPLMMVNDYLFLLIQNVFGKGPSNDGEGFFVSADLECFRKGS